MTTSLHYQPIVDRLDGLGFAMIGSNLEYAGLKQVPSRLPAAFVVSDSEVAASNRMASQIVDQKVTEIFAIVLIVNSNTRSMTAKGSGISPDFDRLRDAVKNRFVAWKHPQASGLIELVDGRLLSVDGTAISYALRFRATYHIRKAPQ
jgi:hypothetical protein